VSSPPFNYSGVWRYRLQDRGLIQVSFDGLITSIAERRLGKMMITFARDRFATQIDIGGAGIDAYCFTAMSRGRAGLVQHGIEGCSPGVGPGNCWLPTIGAPGWSPE
jgi:hypothetical protein